jgi:Response regulator containing a CheY-like receiver domain and an HD-GYP domain
MPGMNGLETATRIKHDARTREVPIIFLTAAIAQPEQTFLSYAAGAVDYLAKPFDPGVLQAKVSVFVDLYLKASQLATRPSCWAGAGSPSSCPGGSRRSRRRWPRCARCPRWAGTPRPPRWPRG